MQERQVMIAAVRQHLLRAQNRMKSQADKKRSDRQFQVGDSVFLKLQPYIQTSLAPRSNSKLCFKYFGPFTIIDKIGNAAYKLKLPQGTSIHPVFHVLLLKPSSSQVTQVSPTLLDVTDALQVPKQFLQRRLHPHGAGSVAQVLVKWSGLPDDLATWEDADHLKQLFPFAPAWGHAGSQGGGSVNNHHSSAQPTGNKARKSSRKKSVPKRVSGTEWACNMCAKAQRGEE
jgi:hypothetical protein